MSWGIFMNDKLMRRVWRTVLFLSATIGLLSASTAKADLVTETYAMSYSNVVELHQNDPQLYATILVEANNTAVADSGVNPYSLRYTVTPTVGAYPPGVNGVRLSAFALNFDPDLSISPSDISIVSGMSPNPDIVISQTSTLGTSRMNGFGAFDIKITDNNNNNGSSNTPLPLVFQIFAGAGEATLENFLGLSRAPSNFEGGNKRWFFAAHVKYRDGNDDSSHFIAAGDSDGDGDVDVNAVPEPTGILLALFGVANMGLVVRRFRRKSDVASA